MVLMSVEAYDEMIKNLAIAENEIQNGRIADAYAELDSLRTKYGL